MPATNPPMCAQNAIPASVPAAGPSDDEPVDQLEHEPEAEHDDRGHGDQLVEEAEEHQRLDPGPRKQHQVRAQHRGDRARRADHRDLARRIHEDVPGRGRDPADEVERRGTARRPSRSSTFTAKIHRNSMLPIRCSQPPCRNMWVNRSSVGPDSQSPACERGHELRRDEPAPLDEPRQRRLAALGEHDDQLPPEGDGAQRRGSPPSPPASGAGAVRRGAAAPRWRQAPGGVTAWASSWASASWSAWASGSAVAVGAGVGVAAGPSAGVEHGAVEAGAGDPPDGGRRLVVGSGQHDHVPQVAPALVAIGQAGTAPRTSPSALLKATIRWLVRSKAYRGPVALARRAVGQVRRREQHVVRDSGRTCVSSGSERSSRMPGSRGPPRRSRPRRCRRRGAGR